MCFWKQLLVRVQRLPLQISAPLVLSLMHFPGSFFGRWSSLIYPFTMPAVTQWIFKDSLAVISTKLKTWVCIIWILLKLCLWQHWQQQQLLTEYIVSGSQRLDETGPGLSFPAAHPVCLLSGCYLSWGRHSCRAYEAGSLCSLQAPAVQVRARADLSYYFDLKTGLYAWLSLLSWCLPPLPKLNWTDTSEWWSLQLSRFNLFAFGTRNAQVQPLWIWNAGNEVQSGWNGEDKEAITQKPIHCFTWSGLQ